jgi:hypothetical protein
MNITAAAAQGAQHHAHAGAVQHPGHHGGVDLVVDGDLEVHEHAEDGGADGAVGRIEQEAAPHEEPAPDPDGDGEHQIPDQGRQQAGIVEHQQGHAQDTARQHGVRSHDALDAYGDEKGADGQPEQVPPDGLSEPVIVCFQLHGSPDSKWLRWKAACQP